MQNRQKQHIVLLAEDDEDDAFLTSKSLEQSRFSIKVMHVKDGEDYVEEDEIVGCTLFHLGALVLGLVWGVPVFELAGVGGLPCRYAALALDVVLASTSARGSWRRSEIFWAEYLTNEGSFRFPLRGERNGQSVSRRMRSIPMCWVSCCFSGTNVTIVGIDIQ